MDPIIEHHFKNIANGMAVQNDDGTLSTVRTIIVDIDGRETLIPTVWDGEIVDDETAVSRAMESPTNWPTAHGDNAVKILEGWDTDVHEFTDEKTGEFLISDHWTPEQAQEKLDRNYEDLNGVPEAERVGVRDILKLGAQGGMLLGTKLGFDMTPVWETLKGQGFALGGLAATTKGITTQEGLDMAKKKFILDDKKADTNGDGKLSTREKEVGKAVQRNVDEEVLADEKIKLNSGGMPCGCGAMSAQDCMCDMMGGIMGYDDVSGNPIPIGSTPENVRDDIDANISTDEYVLPAHVVKWHGIKHIQMMQSEAEMGLMAMKMEGLIHHVEEEPSGESAKDTKVSGKSDTKQEKAKAPSKTQEDVPSEDIDVEIATVEVDDKLDDKEGTKKVSPKTSKLPGLVKKQKVAYLY